MKCPANLINRKHYNQKYIFSKINLNLSRERYFASSRIIPNSSKAYFTISKE
jgi:hypothetical protein